VHHPGDRKTGQKNAIEARGHQQIAILDVGVGRQKTQFQLSVAETENHRAQAGPHDLYRHGLLLVGDQRHFGNEGKYPRHLPDNAGIVDHRLPGDDLVLLSLVDDDPPRIGVARCRKNLCHLAVGLLPLLDAEQLAQALVLDLQLLGTQQRRHVLETGSFQLGVLILQTRHADEVAAGVGEKLCRQMGELLHGKGEQ
jgi:hypothetical protein